MTSEFHPQHALTVFYDAECSVCRHLCGMIKRRDSRGRIAFVSLRAPEIETGYPHLRGRNLQGDVHALLPEGRVAVGADAVHEALRLLPRWRWWAWVYRLPFAHGLCVAAYRHLALNRHRWGLAWPDGPQVME